MNQKQAVIWHNLESFDLDQPLSEYCFSVRLASENGWSQCFAQRAIVEYKKFMFLATVSTEMVSPSHLVDVVWHQHLIFTQSYQRLSDLTGKRIEHVPSTHHNEERDKFNSAKNHTMTLYREFFGEPPADIWFEKEFLPALTSPTQKSVLRPSNYFAILLVASMFVYYPLAVWVKPILVEIDNPYFLIGYWGFLFLLFAVLWAWREAVLSSLVRKMYAQGALQNFSPLELTYLTRRYTADIVHGVMNELVKKGRVAIESDNQIRQITHARQAQNAHEFAVLQSLEERGGTTYYPALLGVVINKPIFTQTHDFCEKVLTKLSETKTYTTVAVVEFIVLGLWLLIGLVRMNTGIEREMPVLFLVLSLVAMVGIMLMYLFLGRLKALRESITNLYRREMLNKKTTIEHEESWEWQYFLWGNTAITASFMPLVTHIDRKNEYGGGSSSCGSSCGGGGGDGGGSSCGGGCGGCGGGGD